MRGHSKTLSKQRCNKNIRTNFFTQRIVTTWNQLPDSIVNAPTMQSFENRLDKYWNNLEVKYNFKADTGTGVAGNIVRPARLSDRTILPRMNRPVGHLRLSGIIRVQQAIWFGLLSQNVR
jgi:hypothetical protein